MTTFDTHNRYELVCPYCGDEMETWRYFEYRDCEDGDDGEVQCEKCYKYFNFILGVEIEKTVRCTTTKKPDDCEHSKTSIVTGSNGNKGQRCLECGHYEFLGTPLPFPTPTQ